MKIFAAKDPEVDKFDPYIGKVVWVKCLREGSKSGEPCYVRPLYRIGTVVEANVIYEHVLEYDSPADIRMELSTSNQIHSEEYKILKPITTLTLSDFYPDGNAPGADTDLSKYIKPDLWVKVFVYKYDFACYINIISIEDGIVRYHVVDAGLIDDHSPSDPYDFDEMPTIEDLNYEDTTVIEGLELITPVDILNTNEIIAELEACAAEMDI